MTKQKRAKKTKSPASAGRLPLREVADEQQDSEGDTLQKEKKSSSRLAKASLEEEPDEEEEEDSPHDSPQLEQEISSQRESSVQPEKEDSPIRTDSSAPPPSGVQDLLRDGRRNCKRESDALSVEDFIKTPIVRTAKTSRTMISSFP